MTDIPPAPRSGQDIASYHAHIYFVESSADRAAILREWIADRFEVELGPWRAEPFGPHTSPSYYFGFEVAQLPVVLPWLTVNNLGLRILVHPNTDNAWADHIELGLWLNGSQPINDALLPHSMAATGLAPEQIHPNTAPGRAVE